MKKESLFISQLIEFLAIPEIDEKNMQSIESIKSIEIYNLYYKYSNVNVFKEHLKKIM